MRSRITAFFFLLPLLLSAQDKHRLREAVIKLDYAQEDTSMVILLNDIGWDTSYEDLHVGLDYCQRSLDLAKKLQFDRGIMIASNSLGTIYADLGDYNNAISMHLQSLATAEHVGNLYSQATSYMNLSIVYQSMEQFDKAHESLWKSLNIYKGLKSKRGICVTYNNLGSVYMDLDSLNKAIVAFHIADSLSLELGRPDYRSHALSGLSSVYVKLEDSSSAFRYIEETMRILDSLDDTYDLAQSIYDHGYALAHFKYHDRAEKEYMRALSLFRQVGMIEQEKQVWQSLGELYEAMGEPSKALVAIKRYHAMQDSIVNERVLKNQHELEEKYNSEKNLNKISQLQQDRKFQGTVVTSLVVGFLLMCILLFVLFNRNKLRKKNNLQLASQNAIIEEKNKNITDSINYARRIQDAVLPSPAILQTYFDDAFIFYRPRDIVSGDFWWFTEKEGKFYLAAADCTGHGVPGGFMSVMGAAFLSEVINEKGIKDPGMILSVLRNKVVSALVHAGDDQKSIRDGMDMAMCVFDSTDNSVEFAGANNPLWLVRNSALTEYDADNFPVGIHEGEIRQFKSTKIQLKKGDTLYMFTDGFADQFGGKDGKKYKYRKMKELFILIASKGSDEQSVRIEQEFNEWKGELEQVDDVLVIGIHI